MAENRRVLRGIRTENDTVISTGADYMPLIHDPDDPVCQKCTLGSCMVTCLRNSQETNQVNRTDWNWTDESQWSDNVVNIAHPPVDLDDEDGWW